MATSNAIDDDTRLDTAARADRARGALLGLAVGDALGSTLEFRARDMELHHTEMTGGGPFRLRSGEWTDDTAMALALADSLIQRQGLEPHDLMTRFVAWWRQGAFSCTGTCFDIGIATRQALTRFERTGKPFAGSTASDDAGNGSLMRLSPAVLFTLGDDEAATRHLAREQGRTTHGAIECLDACELFADILRDAILGRPDPLRVREGWSGTKVGSIARGSYHGKTRAQIRSSGYVIDTLEAALWCVTETASFEDALVLAVNLGHDADTVGAVTGQIAGAIYGASAIPTRWLEPLAWQDRIEDAAARLLATTSRA